MIIPFVGQAYENRSIPLSAQKCINFFPEIEPQDARAVTMLQSVSGTREFLDLFGGQIRGMHFVTKLELLIIVANREVFSITEGGASTSLGVYPGTGLVSMADNGEQVGFAGGDAYYVFDSTDGTFEEVQVGGSDTIVPVDIAYQDGYFILPERESQRWFITGINNAKTIGALDFEEANSSPDDILAVVTMNGRVWFLGENSYDSWYNSGAAAFPFSKIDNGATNSYGIAGTFAKTVQDGVAFWCSSDGRMYMSSGGTPQPFSHHGIENALRQYPTLTDCEASHWTENGHRFIAFSFPSGNQTWVYDSVARMWHERGSYSQDQSDVADNIKIWDARFVQFGWNNRNIVGSRSRARLGELDLDLFTEYGELMKCLRTSPVIHSNQKSVFTGRLELVVETGRAGQSENPQILLSWSDNGGVSFKNKLSRSLGKVGEYLTRPVWFKLGKSVNRVYKIEITDNVPRNIIECVVEGSVGYT